MILPKIYRTYFVLVLLPLLILNFMVSHPRSRINGMELLYRYDNYMRSVRYPLGQVVESERFDKEKHIIYKNVHLRIDYYIGYILSCRIFPDMIAKCRLIIYSISFGSGSVKEFQYQWQSK